MLEPSNADLMLAELEEVLADPLFRRSPVLSRLLRYLVETSVRGEGRQLKSYAVAVYGLGKAASFDSQADSYARVHVVRLRRTLDAYYAREGALHSNRLVIESGAYEVKLVPMAGYAPVEVAELEEIVPRFRFGPALGRSLRLLRKALGSRRGIAAGVLLLLLPLGLLAIHLMQANQAEKAIWSNRDFPFVAIAVSAEDSRVDPAMAALVDATRRSLLTRAARYEGVRVTSTGPQSGDYLIDVELRKGSGALFADVLVVRNEDHRIIWSTSEPLGSNGDGRVPAAILFRILQPTGVIHAFERRWHKEPDTPYRCWLRHGMVLQQNPFQDDPLLEACAAKWYAAVPDHPVAAALHGWSLISEANRKLTEDGRSEALRAAIALIEDERTANPNSPMLQVVAMRAHALAGDRAAVIEAARLVQALNPDNLDLRGAAGTYLVFYNVEGGEKLLDSAIAGHFNPPVWYFIGKTVAAMMRDDPEAGQIALARLQMREADGTALHILQAALAARRGKTVLARAYWQQAAIDQPVLRVQPELVLRRLPVAPEVRDRLREWLGPVLGPSVAGSRKVAFLQQPEAHGGGEFPFR